VVEEMGAIGALAGTELDKLSSGTGTLGWIYTTGQE
jgi:hypothetical protein